MGINQRRTVQYPFVELFNFISGEIKEGNHYFEDCIKNFTREKEVPLIRGNNSMMGESTTIIGRLTLSFHLERSKKNAWFIFVGYGEKSRRVYKCVYFK